MASLLQSHLALTSKPGAKYFSRLRPGVFICRTNEISQLYLYDRSLKALSQPTECLVHKMHPGNTSTVPFSLHCTLPPFQQEQTCSRMLVTEPVHFFGRLSTMDFTAYYLDSIRTLLNILRLSKLICCTNTIKKNFTQKVNAYYSGKCCSSLVFFTIVWTCELSCRSEETMNSRILLSAHCKIKF